MSWVRIGVVALLLGFTISTVSRSVIPGKTALAGTQRMVEAQEAENQGLRDAIRDRTVEADALRTDPWLVWRILRDEYRIADEGEILIR